MFENNNLFSLKEKNGSGKNYNMLIFKSKIKAGISFPITTTSHGYFHILFHEGWFMEKLEHESLFIFPSPCPFFQIPNVFFLLWRPHFQVARELGTDLWNICWWWFKQLTLLEILALWKWAPNLQMKKTVLEVKWQTVG